jgi:purine-nucleoside/S-methyl-5'-thioadenosine phosphorylase / adenosine deaminase
VSAFLEHALLTSRGARHGFGLRGAPEPPGTLRARQVHGSVVARARGDGSPLGEADAVVCALPDVPVAVVTADCVPILLAGRDARVVAAVHAGWRGLAAGVIEAALDALARAGAGPGELAAAVGPHIGPCCYEVDEPVLERLGARFGSALAAAATPTRPGHARVDLGALARIALLRSLSPGAVGGFRAACTRCDAARFESHRRDGARSGRMVHWITPSARPAQALTPAAPSG